MAVTIAATLVAFPALAQNSTTNCQKDYFGNVTCQTREAPGIDWSIANRPAPNPAPINQGQILQQGAATVPVYRASPRIEREQPAPAGVPFNRGNDFLRLCDHNSWKLSCMAYSTGLLHGSQGQQNTFCKPEGVDMGQLHRIALRYIEDHPKESHHTAASLILRAWEDAYPCAG